MREQQATASTEAEADEDAAVEDSGPITQAEAVDDDEESMPGFEKQPVDELDASDEEDNKDDGNMAMHNGSEEEELPTLVVGDSPGGSTLADARNGFNKLSRMAM
eukprot:14560724-Ditylum_brightwellii.AAC.1